MDRQDEIDALIALVETSDISSTRAVLCRILEVINNPNTSALDLKNMIEMDPPLAARVLKRANSAYYGMRRHLPDILEAIVCIGFEAVRELALNQTVCELFQRDEIVHGYSRSALWIHCVASALCGKMIYRREFCRPGEKIYIAGLLHDIGIIVEDQFAREMFLRILEDYAREPGPGLYACERRRQGYTHAELGAALAAAWNFPEELCAAIGAEVPPASVENETDRLLAALCASRWACQARGIGYVETPGVSQRDLRAVLQTINVSERGLEFIMDEVSEQIKRMRDDGWF